MNRMMALRLLATVLGYALVTPAPVVAQQAACWQPEGVPDYLLSTLRDIVSGSDSLNTRLRAAFDLPAMPADSVTLVTNDSICQSFFAASDSLVDPGVTTSALLLIRAGSSRWVLYHGYPEGGDILLYYVLNDDKVLLKRVIAGM